MKRCLLLAAGLFLIGNGAVLLMYRGVVRGSYLFVTAGTILTPLVVCDFIIGFLCLAAFVRDTTQGHKAS